MTLGRRYRSSEPIVPAELRLWLAERLRLGMLTTPSAPERDKGDHASYPCGEISLAWRCDRAAAAAAGGSVRTRRLGFPNAPVRVSRLWGV